MTLQMKDTHVAQVPTKRSFGTDLSATQNSVDNIVNQPSPIPDKSLLDTSVVKEVTVKSRRVKATPLVKSEGGFGAESKGTSEEQPAECNQS